MKNVDIDMNGFRYKWEIRGVDEDGCVADIQENMRTEMTDFVGVMFAEQYGCVAEVQRFRLMSHNQYQAYLQHNAGRLYADSGYSMEDYRRDAEMVEVLPFRLEQFRLDEDVLQYINRNFASISYTQTGDVCLQCRVNSSVGAGLMANELGCDMVCNQGSTGFYKNDINKLILYFCDGDVSLVVCNSQKNYAYQLAEFNRFFDLEEYGVCIEVYFDNVHMDNVFLPRENVGMAISSMLQRGYDGYHSATKECWEAFLNKRKCPSISFRVVEAPTMVRDFDFDVFMQRETGVDAVLADAVTRSVGADSGKGRTAEFELC